jgi:hypothetical protein
MKEYKYLKFPNNQQGQEEKLKALQEASSDGWRVISETITPGKFKGGKACCLFVIFAPCAFFAGHSDGEINITLERDVIEKPTEAESSGYNAETDEVKVNNDDLEDINNPKI